MAETQNTLPENGLPPEPLIHVGPVHETPTRISIVDYSREYVEVQPLERLDDLVRYREGESVTWVMVEGLTDAETIGRLGELFTIHPLVIEDILNVHQRPKFEDYDDYLFIVVKSLVAGRQGRLEHEQVAIVLLEKFVLVFREKSDALLRPLIQRIETSKGRFRSMGADYLAYAILDTIVDGFFGLVDTLDEIVNGLEDRLLTAEPTHETLLAIQRVKKLLIHIRRYVTPVREVMAAMLRSDSELIREKTRIYLRDVADHAIRIAESVESYKEILASLMDIYVSSVSNRLNGVMKVLTIFASIFIPLTFLTGIYGMNFEYMPELKWKYAYFCMWGLFIAIPLGLLYFFKKKKWL